MTRSSLLLILYVFSRAAIARLRLAKSCASNLPVGNEFDFSALTLRKSPNGVLRYACIGVGNKGRDDWQALMSQPSIEIVVLCDMDESCLAYVRKRFPFAHVSRDWRGLLIPEEGKIGSVNISIPDHNHAVSADSAKRRGYDVYLQKPLCKTLARARICADSRGMPRRSRFVTRAPIRFSQRRIAVRLVSIKCDMPRPRRTN